MILEGKLQLVFPEHVEQLLIKAQEKHDGQLLVWLTQWKEQRK